MAPEKLPCKVIIVGGSISGLSLANMLEQAGIDFIVLEAYKEIAPQVGASITIWPHFARLLDQIGCWYRKGDSLRGLVDDFCNHACYRDQQGDIIFEFRGMADVLEKRHGYPSIFIDRQMLVSALYQNLQQKDKVLVQKRLLQIEQTKDGVRAITQDGSTYTADIIIGADGIHSTVREIMHVLGHNSPTPDIFEKDEYSKIPCTYKCIFGMSTPTKGIEKGTTHVVMGKDYSHGIGSGPGKIYWFLNVKNSEVTHGKGVPQYTVEDERRLAEQHFKDRLNEHDTFEDLYKNRIISRLTPLHEYQWRRWYFGRIMTIGDASHKIHPISGNGGAAGMEDAAALVNALKAILQQDRGQARQHVSTEEFQEVFAETQRVREKRTMQLLKESTKVQQGDAMESKFAPFAVKYVLPHVTGDVFFSLVASTIVQGQRVQSLPVPRRPRYVPFNDELPAQPLGNMPISTACFILLYSVLFYLACLPSTRHTFSAGSIFLGLPDLNQTITTDHHSHNDRRPTGGDLSAAFFLIPIILIWNIEAHRRGNARSLGSWPITLLGVAALSPFGAQKVLPLCFLVAACNFRRVTYALTSGRPVPLSVVKVVTGVTLAIYAPLTAMLCLPACRHALGYQRSATWHLLPIGISALIQFLTFSSTFDKEPGGTVAKSGDDKDYLRPYLDRDYSTLMNLYRILLVLACLASVFVPSSLENQHIITAAIVAFCLHTALEMRRLGYVTTRQALTVSIVILLSAFVVGPVPLYIGTWYWRETVIHGLSK